MFFPEMKIKNFFSKNKFFLANKPEQQVIAKFLDAVMEDSDDVWAFVSKVYSPRMDLDGLREVLGAGAKIMVSKAFFFENPKNCLTRSIYIENAALDLKKFLHLKIVKDNGAWKIYGVEQEECIKIR